MFSTGSLTRGAQSADAASGESGRRLPGRPSSLPSELFVTEKPEGATNTLGSPGRLVAALGSELEAFYHRLVQTGDQT